MRNNWFKGSILLLFFVVILLILNINIISPSSSRLNNFDLQSKCSNLAKKYFDDKGYKIDDGFDYKNHYNLVLNKCFILISSYSMKDDFITMDLYDAVGGNRYATFNGHNNCDPRVLSLLVPSDLKKCQLDSGSIWINGNDMKEADIVVGFEGFLNGNGIGNENTLKQFMEKIDQGFMTN